MFLDCPLSHLIDTEGRKKISRPTPRQKRKCDPPQGLPKIISTTNQPESPSIRNTPFFGYNLITLIFSSKPSQNQMTFIITKLETQPTANNKVNC